MLRKLFAALLCATLPIAVFAADPAVAVATDTPSEAQFIRHALIEKGKASGLDKSPELEKRVEAFRQEQLALLAFEAAVDEGMPDFSARTEELYQTRKASKYRLPLRLRVRVLEMRVEAGKEAEVAARLEGLRTEIQAGTLDFKTAVLAHSTDPERKLTEGDSQWFAAGQKPTVLYEAAEKLSPEQPLSDVVKDKNIAYLLYYLDRKAPETLSFEAVKADILKELQTEYREVQRKVVLEGLRVQFQQQAGAAPAMTQAAKM